MDTIKRFIRTWEAAHGTRHKVARRRANQMMMGGEKAGEYKIIDEDPNALPIIKKDGQTLTPKGLTELGKGAQGVVFLYEDESGTQWAVKYNNKSRSNAPECREQLPKCGQVECMYVGETKDDQVTAMEKMEGDFSYRGKTRDDIVDAAIGTHEVEQKLQLVRRIAEAVRKQICCLNEQANMYYLDLKLENVMWRREKDGSFTVKLVDLGSLYRADEEVPNMVTYCADAGSKEEIQVCQFGMFVTHLLQSLIRAEPPVDSIVDAKPILEKHFHWPESIEEELRPQGILSVGV